jgi:hypothetical protein
MYAKALKQHIDHIPDLADQFSGSISLSQDYDRQERARKMNDEAKARNEMWKKMVSFQRLRLLNIKNNGCAENPLSGEYDCWRDRSKFHRTRNKQL